MEPEAQSLLSGFFKQYPVILHKKGSYIMHPGETFDEIYFIESGHVRLFSINASGKETTINVVKPLLFFSFLFGLTGRESKYYFEAITPVKFRKAPKDAVIDFMHHNPCTLMEMTRYLATGFNELLTSYEALASTNAFYKVASTIYLLANRFGERNNNTITFTLKFSHHTIAGFMGLTRETVSAQMKRLENEGYITKKGTYLVIPNIPAFEKLVS